MTVTHLSKITAASGQRASPASVRLLLVVEGANDWAFLRRISRMLHANDASLPNLAQFEQRGELIVIPFGGGHVASWAHRLAPLRVPEFHIYDRELPPETEYRQQAAELVNRRERCRAVLTRKRNLENYLHAQAIAAVGGVEVQFDDFAPVAEIVARQLFEAESDKTPWQLLTRRARSRLAHRAKRWLNAKAVEQMTVELLRERDPHGEVVSWLVAIRRLMDAD